MSGAMIAGLTPHFGSKRTMAPMIAEALGAHTLYVEPFCGSMAVLLAKPRSRMEIVNDLHGDLINLARVIRDPVTGPKLYRHLRRTLVSEEALAFAWAAVDMAWELDFLNPSGDIARAYVYFVASWLGRNGFAGTVKPPRSFAVRYTANGGDPAVRFRSAVASIPAWRRRLEGVTILHRDGFDLLARIDDAATTAVYADPPYLVKGGKYLHDFAEADHGRLAAALRRFERAKVVVSYYADDRLADLYPGWEIRPVKATKNIANQDAKGTSGAVAAPEVLILNRSAAEGGVS